MDTQENEPSAFISECQNCSGPIEFEASQTGAVIPCPHCGLETRLVLPKEFQPVVPLPPVLPTPEEIRNGKIIQIKTALRARLESGKPVFLYDSILVPVDSALEGVDLADEFNLSYLRQLGLLGWDIVQAVPKTMGVALKNISFGSSMGETWGAGMGGNVTGVHIIIKKSVALADLTDDPGDEVGEFIRNHLSDF